MDGKELVHNPAPVAIETSIAGPLSRSTERLPGRQSRSFAVAVLTVVVLTALVIAVYFARARQTRLRTASEAATHSAERSAPQSSAQSTSEVAVPQPQASGLVSIETPVTDTVSPAQSREQSAELSRSSQTDLTTLDSSQSRTSLSHARLPANPVSTKGPSGNSRGPVIVRLNNGASIKADEAWEKKEGIWYRQAGMVTFLKRSRVRTIERSAPPVRSKSAAANEEKHTATQQPLHLARLEPVAEKKESRVTSFLKKTGRILKRPFKF